MGSAGILADSPRCPRKTEQHFSMWIIKQWYIKIFSFVAMKTIKPRQMDHLWEEQSSYLGKCYSWISWLTPCLSDWFSNLLTGWLTDILIHHILTDTLSYLMASLICLLADWLTFWYTYTLADTLINLLKHLSQRVWAGCYMQCLPCIHLAGWRWLVLDLTLTTTDTCGNKQS